MQIKRLRLTGFKSFVEPTELRIEPGLTGIVGPNGCGKSNLLEAIRWVMGESSPKSMRSGGMEDVIFAGTATRPSRDFAEVTIHCDTEGELVTGLSDPKDSDELEIIRRIDRGAGSAYRANGRDVRAKDVTLIFADAATGAHSPALVSQGKIAHIISARPTERRAMLEEAAGIAGLHVRRKDAEQKLRATESNLTRLGEIIIEMEGRVQSLRRQARTADKYRQISSEIRRMEAVLTFLRWREAADAAKLAQDEAQKAEAAVLVAQSQIDALSAAQRTHSKDLALIRSQLQQYQVDFARITADRIRLESEAANVEQRLTSLTEQQQSLNADHAREDELTQSAHQAMMALEAESKQLQRESAAAETERAHLVKADQRAHHHLRDTELTLARAQAEAAHDAAERRILFAARDSASAAKQKADATLARLLLEQDRLGSSADLLSRHTDAADHASQAQGAISQSEAVLQAAIIAREAAAQHLQQCESKWAEARAEYGAIKSEMEAISRSLATAKIAENRILDQLQVTAGYEIALAAALGDDVNAGLDSTALRHWGESMTDLDAPCGPDHSQPLSNFVNGPSAIIPRLRQIFLVDADEGQKLQVGQRLVTHSGQLRRWDGFRSDGDGAEASDNLIRRNRLAKLQQNFPSAEERFCKAKAAHQQADFQNNEAIAAEAAARKTMNTADAQHRTALRAADQAQSALTHHQQTSALLDDRLREAEAQAREAEADLTLQLTAITALPDDRAAQKALKDAEDRQQQARRLASDSRAMLSAHDHSTSSRSQRLAVVTAEIRGWRSRAGEGAKRLAEYDRRAAALARDIAMLQDQPDKYARQLAEVKSRSDATEAALRRAEDGELQATATLQDCENKLSQFRDTSADLREARAAALARFEAADQRRSEMARQSGERFGCPPALLPARAGFDAASHTHLADETVAHDNLVKDRDRLGPVNLIAADELAALEAEQAQTTQDIAELQEAVNRLRGSIGSLNREGRARLIAAFEEVNGHFQRLFTDLFGGGSAQLQWIDSDDPLEAGLEIMAQPPGKKLGSLSLLSGGEQALTAVALIFGLFLANPAPICVLDEVDAPLDDANIDRFCDLLDRMARETRTRYLIVTHNAVTMARMHRLFGVTMVERGVSRLVSVDLGGAEYLLAAE